MLKNNRQLSNVSDKTVDKIGECKKSQEDSETRTTILFVHYGDDWIRGSEKCLLELLKNINIAKYRTILWCNSSAMKSAAEELGVEVVQDEFHILFGWLKPRYNFKAYIGQIKKGLALVNHFGVDLIHSNSAAPTQWMLPVAKISGCPIVTQLHSPYIFRDRLSLLVHHVDRVIGVSRAVVAPLLEELEKKEKVVVVYNGIDTDGLSNVSPQDAKKKLKLKESELLLVTVGSLIHRKGIDTIIESLSILRTSGFPVSLVVIGDGDERENLERYASNTGVAEHVFFLGERNDAQAWLRGSDILVSGAREEAFGLVFAEAGLAKLPVVATRVGGIPEVVDNEGGGILVSPSSPVEIANAVARLFYNPLMRTSMGEKGFSRVMENFTVDANTKKMTAVYESIVSLNDSQKTAEGSSSWEIFPLLKKILSVTLRKFVRRLYNEKKQINQKELF